jgi:hypothetical protein
LQQTTNITSTFSKYCTGYCGFGFNGQEKDQEIYNNQSTTTATFWEYDGRIGRRWNLDPKPITEESPYAVNRNNPIINIDPKGDFGFIGALIGGAAGAIAELGSQMVGNMIAGKPVLKSIDWADVVISAGEGAIMGATCGASALATSSISGGLKAAIDFKDGKPQIIGGKGKFEKTPDDFKGDLIAEGIGVGLGKLLPVGDLVQSGTNSVLKKSFLKNGILSGKNLEAFSGISTATNILTQELFNSYFKGGFKAIWDLNHKDNNSNQKDNTSNNQKGGAYVKINETMTDPDNPNNLLPKQDATYRMQNELKGIEVKSE